jgi:hypothetical protein
MLTADGAGGPSRLFDALTGPSHTLLLFAGGPETHLGATVAAMGELLTGRYAGLIRPWLVLGGDAAQAPPRWGGEVLRDPDAALHRRYGAGAPCLYLIRPDGYIGYRAQPPDAVKLRAYLERLFVA